MDKSLSVKMNVEIANQSRSFKHCHKIQNKFYHIRKLKSILCKVQGILSKQIEPRTLNISSSFRTNDLVMNDRLRKRICNASTLSPSNYRNSFAPPCSPFSHNFVSLLPGRSSYWHAKPTRNLARTIRTHIKCSNFNAISRKKEKCSSDSELAVLPAPPTASQPSPDFPFSPSK